MILFPSSQNARRTARSAKFQNEQKERREELAAQSYHDLQLVVKWSTGFNAFDEIYSLVYKPRASEYKVARATSPFVSIQGECTVSWITQCCKMNEKCLQNVNVRCNRVQIDIDKWNNMSSVPMKTESKCTCGNNENVFRYNIMHIYILTVDNNMHIYHPHIQTHNTHTEKCMKTHI